MSISWRELDFTSRLLALFAFGELKLLKEVLKIIGLIARDESQHMTITQNILNKWRDGDDPAMVEIAKEEEINVCNV